MSAPTSKIVQKIIQNLESAHNNLNYTCTEPLKVWLMSKKQVVYVTDGHVIIQAIMCLQVSDLSRQKIPVDPFNRIRTSYYNYSTKQANLFMFNQNDKIQRTQFSSAYNPCFHFQQRLDTFKSQLSLAQMKNLTQMIIANHWSFRIVNIANSCYYGVVLQIYEYERYQEKIKCSPHASSILYEKELAYILDNLRLNDMKKSMRQVHRQNYISLFYYKKNAKISNNQKHILSNFVNADKNGKLIKFNPQITTNYLPLGNIMGVLRFIRPMLNYTKNKKIIINYNLFRQKNQTILKDSLQFNDHQSSEDDSSEGQQIQPGRKNPEIIEDMEMESSEEEQQPLKKIYLKQLQKINIV